MGRDAGSAVKYAYVDAEFTGEHARATLVSIAIVGENDEELSLTLDDYDQGQVTPWLRENVLAHIDSRQSVSSRQAFQEVRTWFDDYADGERVHLVSAGKLLDLMLLFELWHHGQPDREYFHHLHGLPEYLNHAAHFDLPTTFFLAGLDPHLDRAAFIGGEVEGQRHEALYDARVVRSCFLKLLRSEAFPRLDSAAAR